MSIEKLKTTISQPLQTSMQSKVKITIFSRKSVRLLATTGESSNKLNSIFRGFDINQSSNSSPTKPGSRILKLLSKRNKRNIVTHFNNKNGGNLYEGIDLIDNSDSFKLPTDNKINIFQ